MDNFQKIRVLLHEYDSLREELLSRYAAQFQSIAALAIVLGGLIAVAVTVGFSRTIVLLMVGAVFVYIGVVIWIDIDIARASRRVRAIEAATNTLAGETLLRWETEEGLGGVVGKHFLNWWGSKH